MARGFVTDGIPMYEFNSLGEFERAADGDPRVARTLGELPASSFRNLAA